MAKLSSSQRKALDEYLVEKKDMITQPGVATSDVAGWCREAGLGEVDTTNITSRVGPTGRLYIHEWPGSEASRKGRLTDRLARNLIVEQIESFRIQMCNAQHQMAAAGVSIPGLGGAVPRWAELVSQMRSDLADTDRREPEEK